MPELSTSKDTAARFIHSQKKANVHDARRSCLDASDSIVKAITGAVLDSVLNQSLLQVRITPGRLS